MECICRNLRVRDAWKYIKLEPALCFSYLPKRLGSCLAQKLVSMYERFTNIYSLEKMTSTTTQVACRPIILPLFSCKEWFVVFISLIIEPKDLNLFPGFHWWVRQHFSHNSLQSKCKLTKMFCFFWPVCGESGLSSTTLLKPCFWQMVICVQATYHDKPRYSPKLSWFTFL